MIFAILTYALLLVGIFTPLIYGIFRGLGYKDPYPTFSSTIDEETKKAAAEAKRTADIMQKNRTDSWTDPNYFKK